MSFEETLAGLVSLVESKPCANRSRLICQRRHAEHVFKTSPQPKQKESTEQIQATVQVALPRKQPASSVSIVASEIDHDSIPIDFWAQLKPIHNHQDSSLDVYRPLIKHDESAIDSGWRRWRLNSTRQSPPPTLVLDGNFPSLAEAAEGFRRSRRNSKTSLPSKSSTNHAVTTTTTRRLKRRDVIVQNWTGM